MLRFSTVSLFGHLTPSLFNHLTPSLFGHLTLMGATEPIVRLVPRQKHRTMSKNQIGDSTLQGAGQCVNHSTVKFFLLSPFV
jgi:hypothetical protein